MIFSFSRLIATSCLSLFALLGFSPSAYSDNLTSHLARLAPSLDTQVLARAVSAVGCAINSGVPPADRLAVIDFSLPSSEKRLWIFDLRAMQLVLEDWVAHGKNSGDNLASRFSNRVGSHQSSLGLFLTAESYSGKHGLSLRMEGLEPGVNDKARERAIVIHGASYVDPKWVDVQGRIGRSLGCPAVRTEIAPKVVDNLKEGQFLFSYYPDEQWLSTSPLLNCGSEPLVSQIYGSDTSS